MHIFNKSKHIIVILTVMAMVFSLAVPVMSSRVSAEDDPVILTVYYGNTIKTTFTLNQLTTLAEGDEYNYSTYNSYPTFAKLSSSMAVTVERIISEAGISMDEIQSNHRIEFKSGQDDESTFLTKKQLTEPRYYFPNGKTSTADGLKGNENSTVGAVIVPAIIALENDEDHARRLMFGQKLPNEQTKEAWCKYVADGGKIIVTTESATQLNKVSINPAMKTVAWGSVIELIHNQLGKANKDIVIYYTIDGRDPSVGASDIYNYATSGRTRNRVINVPAVPGTFTVKAYATKYGYIDSVVNSVEYPTTIGNVTNTKANVIDYKSTKVSWSSVIGAEGYYVYRSTSVNGPYTKIGPIKGTNFTDTNLKTGKAYYYKVTAYKGNINGPASSVVSVRTVLNKPTGLKVKIKGKKKLIITTPKVIGASGYVIYRSTKKSSGFKKIKTFKKSTLKYTDKKIKSGKKYYYKVKAYRTVDGKKVYSNFSSVVARKAK